MSIRKVLNDLENSWERDDILLKIKNGYENEEITNEFLKKNEVQIKENRCTITGACRKY